MTVPIKQVPATPGGNVVAEPASEALAAADTPKDVELPSGSSLDASETLTITRAQPTHLIVFAGSAASGKTTLLASVYEKLQEGPFADLLFAGSRSLVGFEEICHLNRLSSGQQIPETERTKRSEQAMFYHLSLVDGAGSLASPVRHEVLISALSGELFRLARDSTDDCYTLAFLRRADVLAVLIDGAKLAELDGREGAVADADGIVRSFLDAGMLNPRTRVEFVFSKYDCIEKAGPNAERFLDRAMKRLLQLFAKRLASIGTRYIAARPQESQLPFAFGVADALRTWLSAASAPADAARYLVDCPDSEREFAKYGWRYRAGKEGSW